jgi:hypothetical protein
VCVCGQLEESRIRMVSPVLKLADYWLRLVSHPPVTNRDSFIEWWQEMEYTKPRLGNGIASLILMAKLSQKNSENSRYGVIK